MAKIKPKISRKAKAAKNYTSGQDVQIRLPDGSIETVNTASPLYAQMYGANQIQSTPGTEAEPINLQEVTVRPPKGFWEQSYDKFQQDNKDSEFIGAMLSPFTYALSVPQQAMMYGATGKVQDPSEALGIENPYLAFAANSIIDPANIVGAGLASKGRALPFLNNLVNPLAGTKIEKYIGDKIPFNFPNTSNRLNLEELRRAYHNSERFLQPDEISFLRKHGYGKEPQYRNDNWTNNFTTDQVNEWWRIRDANRNQLPPPPSEIEFMPDGTTRTVYNRFVPPNQNIIPTPEGGLFGMTREQTEAAWRNLQQNSDWNNSNIFTSSKPKTVNKSGLTKEEALQKASSKDKDVISKMSETEFENTVLKPTGEVVPYESQADLMPHFTGSNNVFAMSAKEYADAFNERLDLLNDIIAKRNKSGVEYRVKGLDENGRLTFYTPEQNIPKKLTPKEQENIDLFNKNPEEWLKNKAGLKKEGDKWTLEENAGSFNSVEEAIQYVRKELDEYLKPQTIKGESTWSVKLNPGQWRGNVEDIANTQYFRSIPGLEMSNTTDGVFADRTPRKGTAAYESINEYLKQLDLGRVKPGFNSQTEHSRSAWENFIKSGRGVGFYGNPRTVYGTMKSVLPYIGTGYLGYQGLQNAQQHQQQEYKQGGSVSNWEIVDDNLPIARNGINIEDTKKALSETQAKINAGQAAKKKYQDDLVRYAKSVEGDPNFKKKVSDFVKQRCGTEGAACISAASKLLEGAGYPIGKGYHQNPTLQKDIISGKLPGFSYDHNDQNLEIGDIIQLTGDYTLTKGPNKGKVIEKAPWHAMTVTGIPSKDSVEWFGSTGSIPSIGFRHYDISNKPASNYEIIKRDFVNPALISTRDSLKEVLRREDPSFEKPSNWKPRYLDFKPDQKLQYTPEGGIDNNPLRLMTKSRIESMYSPLFEKKEELMKKYNLTNSEFNNLAKILGGIGEQETENAGLTSLRYGVKRDPALGPIAQFFGKVLSGDISNAFDPGQYSMGPWQTKADYVPKTNYKRGSVEEAFATLADRYKNQVPSKYRGTEYGYGLAANKYKGLKQDRNEYLKNVLNYANMFDIFEKDYSSSNDNPEINYDKFKESEKKAKTQNRERIALPGQSSLTNFFQSGGNIPVDPWEIIDDNSPIAQTGNLVNRFKIQDTYERSPIKFQSFGNTDYGLSTSLNNLNFSGGLNLEDLDNPTLRTGIGYRKKGFNINVSPSFSKDQNQINLSANYNKGDWSGNLNYETPSKFGLGLGYDKNGFSGNVNYNREGSKNLFNTQLNYQGEDFPLSGRLAYDYNDGHSASANLGFNKGNFRSGLNYDYSQVEGKEGDKQNIHKFGINVGGNFGKKKKWSFDTSANTDLNKNYNINAGLRYRFQEGGDIPVDPMGYLNPDNYDEPAVIIPSPEISMKEKNGKPLKKGKLLGIDNTGYAQMMYPGEDYTFPGDYVTEYPLPEAGGGYRVIRSNERKGKTHKVIGPDGTVKFFGDSKLGQHPKDPARKKAFYARHKKNLAKNPYFRAFARKTWAEGGLLDFAQDGLSVADKIQLGLDAAQFVPNPYIAGAAYLGSLPFTTYDVMQDLYKGNYKQAGLDALGYIPAFKAFKYGMKGEKFLDTTSKLAKQLAKANMTVNTTNLAVDAKKKKEGGMLPDLAAMAAGGQFLTVGGEYHRIYKNADGDIMVNHPKEDKGKWDTINLTDKAGAKTVADGVAATKKWHRENPYAFGGLQTMQTGGTRPPIYVDNPNDPRLQNYTDSLYNYNYAINKLKEHQEERGDPFTSKFLKDYLKYIELPELDSYNLTDSRYSKSDRYLNPNTSQKPNYILNRNMEVEKDPNNPNYNKVISATEYLGYSKPVQPVLYKRREFETRSPLFDEFKPTMTSSRLEVPTSKSTPIRKGGDAYWEMKEENGKFYQRLVNINSSDLSRKYGETWSPITKQTYNLQKKREVEGLVPQRQGFNPATQAVENYEPSARLARQEFGGLPKAQTSINPGLLNKTKEYSDYQEYLKAKQAYDDSSAYYNYYKLQKQNEFENKPDFFENFMSLADKIIWEPINYLSGAIEPEKRKQEEKMWSDWNKNSFDFFRELDIARAKGDVNLAKQIIHKYGYDNTPKRKELFEKGFTKPLKQERLENIKELWNNDSFDKTPYKNFEDFKQKQENLWNYGDMLIAANPNFRWSNPVNSPDLIHKNIEPTGQWRGLAYNNSMMIPPSVKPVYVKTDEPKAPQKVKTVPKPTNTSKPIEKPKPEITRSPDTLKLFKYSRIVDGKRVPITKEEYDKVSVGATESGSRKVNPQGKVIKVVEKKAFGGLHKAQDGFYNMQRALELGYNPDDQGHWPSVDSETGMWLKSKEHPTAWMEYLYGYTLNPEVQKNFKHPVVNPEGYFGENQLQYIPKQAFGGNLILEKYQEGGEEKSNDAKFDLEQTKKEIDYIIKNGFGTFLPKKSLNKQKYAEKVFDIYKYANSQFAKNNPLELQEIKRFDKLANDPEKLKPNLQKLKETLPKKDYKFPEVVDKRTVDQFGNPIKWRKGIKQVNPLIVAGIAENSFKNDIDPYTSLAIALQETNLGRNEKHSSKNKFQFSPTEFNYDPLHDDETLPLGYVEWLKKDPYNSQRSYLPFEDPTHPDYQKINQARFNDGFKFLKEKFKLAKRLNKTGDAEAIQAWNGYGKVFKTPGDERGMYGIKYENLPKKTGKDGMTRAYLDMNENPIYGKTIVNLRDSVIKQSPDIVKIVEKFRPKKEKGGSVWEIIE